MPENNSSLVRMEHIYKSFNARTGSETELFSDFSFSIEEGEFISVVGSNGSGKTTLLNLICGNLAVDGGSIFLRDKDISKMPEHQRAAHIGRVFQNPAKGTCPSLTILENLSLVDNKGKPFGLSRCVEKKRLDYYKSQLELLQLGLENKIELPVGVLSGGQRQALALLISTLTPIDLLVLDEHTAALDPKSSENVMYLTDKLVREKKLTSIMVTHNLRFAVEYGSRVVMMHSGRVLIDAAGEDKRNYAVENLLKVFNEISIECGN